MNFICVNFPLEFGYVFAYVVCNVILVQIISILCSCIMFSTCFYSGESPSSSASDVDNTNNQTVAEKTALSRGSGSHAGNHVIAPRNRPSFVRLLDFVSC